LDSKAQRYHEHLRSLDHGAPLDGMMIEYLASHAMRGRELLDEFLIGIVPQGEKYAGRLVIPYLTRAGVKAIKYRCLANHDCKEVECAKYILNGDVRIFNPAAFQQAKNTIGISEGEVDAMLATLQLGIPTVGFPGTEMWKVNRAVWKFALRDYDEILVFADGDRAGLEYARTLVEDLGATRAYLVRCDEGHDVASMIAQGKAETLRERAGL
jgi:hypothetical protein